MEQVLEQLIAARDKANRSAAYQAGKDSDKTNYHLGQRDGLVEAISIIKRLTEGEQ